MIMMSELLKGDPVPMLKLCNAHAEKLEQAAENAELGDAYVFVEIMKLKENKWAFLSLYQVGNVHTFRDEPN